MGTTNPQSLLSIAGTAEFGSGDNGTPVAETIRGAAASGSNITGANLTLDASNGTGNAGSGDLIFRTAPTFGGGASPVFDAASPVQHINPNTLPVSWSHTMTSQPNSILIVTVSYSGNTASSTGVTYNGLAMTKVTNPVACNATTPNCSDEMWYYKNPASGTHTVMVTTNGASSGIVTGSSSYYNVDPVNTFGTIFTNSGRSAGFSNNVTTVANQLVVDGFAGGGNGGYTKGASQTLNYEDHTFNAGGSSYIVAAGASTTVAWTESPTDSWAEIAAPLNAPANTTADVLTDRFHITANGNIGINTANPTALLDIAGNASESGNLTFRGGGAQKVNLLNNSSLGFYNSVGGDAGLGANPALFIANSGNVGIGTQAPVDALDVRATSGTLSVASISGQTSFAGLVVDNSGKGDLFTASSSGLSRFVITQAGNVGYRDNVPR